MGTGPEIKADAGHDLALTELDDGFVLEAGTPAGRRAPRPAAGAAPPISTSRWPPSRRSPPTARGIGNPLQTAGLRDRLLAKLEHPRWAEVAKRCLSCGNCTLACPTCFCTSVERATDLAGSEAVNERVWDSCFSPGFAKVAGGDFRAQPKHRYRQWLTHKFASWWDQFGSSGCTGCGRCITFCPVGIDVREELRSIAPAQPAPRRAEVRARSPTTARPTRRRGSSPSRRRRTTRRRCSWPGSTRRTPTAGRASS